MEKETANSHCEKLLLDKDSDNPEHFKSIKDELATDSRKEDIKTKGTTNPSSNQDNSGIFNWSKRVADSPEVSHATRNFLYQSGLRKNWLILQNLSSSSKDCLLCGKKSYETVVIENLNSKYLTTRESYEGRVVSDIIYNENTHITSVFKDFLVYDDSNEFLKRFYTSYEIPSRSLKIFQFYDKYSKVFPCYIILEEKREMFKNIERKQKVIDEKQKHFDELKKKTLKPSTNIFTAEFMRELNEPDSILSKTSLDLSNSTLIQQYSIQTNKLQRKKVLANDNLKQLLDKFIAKDTLNIIEISQTAITPVKTVQEDNKGKLSKKKRKVGPSCNRKSSSLQPGTRTTQGKAQEIRNRAKNQSRNCQSVIKILSSPREPKKGKLELDINLLKQLPLALNHCKSGALKKRTTQNPPKPINKPKTLTRPSSSTNLKQSASTKGFNSSRRRSIVLTDKKIIAIDIDSLNKNLLKQKLVLDLKSVRGSIKPLCNGSTPGPGHKKFKSSYLNSLKQKIKEKSDTKKKFAFDNLLVPPKKTALIVKSKGQYKNPTKRVVKPSFNVV